MVSVERLTSEMFPELYAALLPELNPSIPEADWRSAFTQVQPGEEDLCGFVLVDAGKLVGVLGAIFSHRQIAGRTVRFLNTHSWYVKPDYRPQSLLLMRQAMKYKEHTHTDFTAGRQVRPLLKRLGFTPLDDRAVLLLPMTGNSESAHLDELTSPESPRAARLTEDDGRILADHQGFGCGHLLIESEGEYCYVVSSRVDRHWLSYCLVHYISNPGLFAKNHLAARRHLLRHSGARYVTVEARHLADFQLPASLNVRANPQFCIPRGVTPAQIDTLYSELAHFKLSILPGLRGRLAGSARPFVPQPLLRYLKLGA